MTITDDNPFLYARCLLCDSRDYVWGHANTDDALNVYGASVQKPLTLRYRPPDDAVPPRRGVLGWLGGGARYVQAPLLARTCRQCGNVQLFAGLEVVPGKPKRG